MRNFLLSCACCFLAASLRAAPELKIETDRIDGLYAAGETATVSIQAKDPAGVPSRSGCVDVAVDNFGDVIVTNLVADFSVANPFTFRVARSDPGFLRVRASNVVCGIGFDVGRIAPGTPNPADFARFWREAIAKYDREIPSVPEVRVDAELSDAAWIVERVAFAAPGGRKVYGFVSRERAAKGRLPGRVEISAAGYGTWSQAPSKNPGRITLKMTVYPFEPDVKLGKKDLYEAGNTNALKRWGVPRYCIGGISESREAFFFYPVILANNRAIDWFAARADVDASKIDYSGTSQGGGLGLAAMALNGHFARGCVFVPALTDLLGYKAGRRKSGWPELVENHPAAARSSVERNAPYFCGVNFARMIRIPIRFCVGHVDVTCPPADVYAAYNACSSADKGILGGIGMTHSAFGDYYGYLDAWSRGREIARPQVRFLAFNIWGDYFGNPVGERADDIAALLSRWDPDIAGFQEVTARFWKSRLVTELEKTYGIVGRGLGVEGRDVYTPVLYRRSRFDLVESGIVLQCPELDESKGAVWAVLKDKATGRKLVAFASHAWWRYDGVGDDWIRLNGAKMLVNKLHELANKHDAAVIGGGDLNAPVESGSLKWIVTHGYSDAQTSAEISPRYFPTEHGDPKRGPDGKYVGRNGANGHNRVSPKFRYLDHIFYDPGRIAARRFDVDISPLACRLSDHHPIVLDFDMTTIVRKQEGEK